MSTTKRTVPSGSVAAPQPGASTDRAKPATSSTSARPPTPAAVNDVLRDIWRKVEADHAAERARREAEAQAAANARAAAYRANQSAAEAVTTLDDWKALTPEQKAMVVTPYGCSKPQYVRTGQVNPSTLAAGPVKDFADALLAKATADIDLDLDPDPYATVGAPQWEVEVVSLASGEILGGNVWVYQDGAMTFDATDVRSHYASRAEADAAGADDGDVNWSCDRAYDHDLVCVEGESSLSWSGH